MAINRNPFGKLQDALRNLNLGTLDDARQGFRRGMQPASEDARSALYKYRDQRGLDEPPQLAEQAARSGLLGNVREIASAAPEQLGVMKPLSGMAFNDEMLRTRLEQGQTIAGNPVMFDEALGTVLDKKRKRYESELENASFGEVYDPEGIELSDSEYRQVISETANKLRREIGEQSILKKLGYTLGAGVGDIAEDRSRSLYWLLNAPQAVTATLADLGVSKTNPNLRSKRNIYGKNFIDAERAGLLRRVGNAPLAETKLKNVNQDDLDKVRLQIGNDYTDDTSLSSYLNPDNYQPAQPGVRRGYDQDLKQPVFQQRRLGPNVLALAGLGATGLATNAGLGLFGSEDSGVPFVGRREGYAAAAQSELDPRETANVINEIGVRYILSRDGNLLPKDDFLLERPDVTPGEFGAYNAYRFDKELDFNPFDDGKMNLGILKTTTEGIHGPEAQLLGQTLSLNEAGVPALGALAGTVAGGLIPNIRQIRLRKSRADYDRTKKGMINRIMGNTPYVKMKTYNKEKDRAPWIKPGSRMDKVTSAIEDQFLTTNPVTGQLDMNVPKTAGLMAAGAGTGLALGTAIGLGLEDQRRRENFAENNPGVDYDVYKRNARDMIDRKYELIKANPNAIEEKQQSSVGFSKRSQQEVLQAEALKQQALINQLIDEERKERALKANADRQVALDRFDEIEASFER